MTNDTNVLLVEDQKELWPMVKDCLSPQGIHVLTAADKEQAFFHLKNNDVDLVLLDLKLDQENGMDILHFLRRQNKIIPIIILSSLSDLNTQRKCFEIGADDYLVKPYVPEELIMRTKRALQRIDHWQPESSDIKQTITLGNLCLNLAEQSLSVNGEWTTLRQKLYDMMLLFIQNPNSVIKKEMFHSLLWHNELYDENSLNVHIHQLRKIIGNTPKDNPRIVTVPKLGYKLLFEKK